MALLPVPVTRLKTGSKTTTSLPAVMSAAQLFSVAAQMAGELLPGSLPPSARQDR